MEEPVFNPAEKKRWRVTLAVLASTLLLAEVAATVIEPLLPPAMIWPTPQTAAKAAQIARLAANDEKVDVVFLGSSVVVQGIDPIAFNQSSGAMTSYNAALDGASPEAVELWAEGVVFPTLDPGVVVIGVTSRDLNDRGVSQESFVRSLAASQGLRETQPQTGFLTRLYSALEGSLALLRIRPQLRQPGTTALEILGKGNEEALLPGPYGAPAIDDAAFAYDDSESWRSFWRSRHFNDFSLGGEELDALHRLVTKAQAQGRRVVLVEMPLHDDYLQVQPGGAATLGEVHALLQQVATEDSAELLNFVNEFEPELFRDPAHLNPIGAEELAGKLARLLTASAQGPERSIGPTPGQ